MSNEKNGELFKAETHWFHIFKEMVDSGELAKMQGSTVKVYLVIKAHTNFSTGRAFPAHETIAEKSGTSIAGVKRSIQELEEMGYITKEKKGRINHYTLREKVLLHDESGVPQAEASWDYLPAGIKVAVADIKNVIMTGDLAGAKIVHIERMNVQIINGDNNTQAMFVEADVAAFANKNPALFDKIVAMREKSKKAEQKV